MLCHISEVEFSFLSEHRLMSHSNLNICTLQNTYVSLNQLIWLVMGLMSEADFIAAVVLKRTSFRQISDRMGGWLFGLGWVEW